MLVLDTLYTRLDTLYTSAILSTTGCWVHTELHHLNTRSFQVIHTSLLRIYYMFKCQVFQTLRWDLIVSVIALRYNNIVAPHLNAADEFLYLCWHAERISFFHTWEFSQECCKSWCVEASSDIVTVQQDLYRFVTFIVGYVTWVNKYILLFWLVLCPSKWRTPSESLSLFWHEVIFLILFWSIYL